MLQQILDFATTPAHLTVEWMILTALVSSLYHKAEANPRLHAVLSFLVSAGVDLPKLWDALGRLLTGNLPPSSAAKKAAAIKPLVGVILLTALVVMLTGCLSSVPVVTVTPANQAQVSSCESSASVHNASVITGLGLGAIGTGMGTVAALDSDQGVRQGLAIGGASAAALAGGAAGIAALAAQNFANAHCTDFVTPPPMKPGNAASGWPAEWPAPRVVSAAQDVDTAHAVMRAAGFVQPDGTTIEMVRAEERP